MATLYPRNDPRPLPLSDDENSRELADRAGSVCEDEDVSTDPFAHVSDRETYY
jgi:hypothetical protein